MNTAEMYLQAQKDGMCYHLINKDSNYDGEIFYQKDKGLFDNYNYRCGPETWNYFEDLMREEWGLTTMTKKEAELKFNIKIID